MSIAAICAVLGIKRQAYYQRKRREQEKAEREEKVLTMVRMIRRRHPQMGVRKLQVKIRSMMEQEGIRMGRDRLYDLLRAQDLLIVRRRKRPRTTTGGAARIPNLLAGQRVHRPDQVWVADITYLETASEGYRYLFLVMDLYSRKVVGWSLAETLEWEHALRAIRRAVRQAKNGVQGLIHHSDHGSQYRSRGYRAYLERRGIRLSMGEVGNAYDNAYAERVIGTLKTEYGLGQVMGGEADLWKAVREAIELYNTDRPHQALEYATPVEVYEGKVEVAGVSVPMGRRKIQ